VSKSITLEKEARRVYFIGDTYAIKDDIKALGGHWDPARRAWWVGTGKVAEAEKLISDLTAAPAATDKSESGDVKKQLPDDTKIVAKVKYKGKTYYAIWVGETKSGEYKCRLTDLAGTLDFWVHCTRPGESANDDVAEVVKRYEPRTVSYGYGRHERTEYQTLGGMRRFVDRLKNDPNSVRPSSDHVRCRHCNQWTLGGDDWCMACGKADYER